METSEQFIQKQVELKLAPIRRSDAVTHEEPFLKRSAELAQTIPEYRQVLITISDSDSSSIDAPDNPTVGH